jgi:hypothetical protein
VLREELIDELAERRHVAATEHGDITAPKCRDLVVPGTEP